MPISKQDKVLVIGAGVCGLSTTLSLLQKGYQEVHLFDKRDYYSQKYDYFQGCDSPSSDMNKVFRCAYGDKVWYQEMAMKSRETFLKWNAMVKDEDWLGGEPLYLNTGNIHLTDQKDLPEFEQQTMKEMGKYGAISTHDSDALERALKVGLNKCAIDPFGNGTLGLLDTTGGLMQADKACLWVLELCSRVGGDRFIPHLGPEIGEVEQLLEEDITPSTGKAKKKCLGIKTRDGKLHHSKLTIAACGPWLPEVVPESGEKLEATGGTVAMIKITDPKTLAKYDQSIFPTWTYKVRDGAMGGLYGFPIRNGIMKVGYRGLKWTNPKPELNSKVKTKWSGSETETNVPLFGLLLIKEFLRNNIPEVQKFELTRLCWYCDSEDNDYLISYSPYHADDSLFVIGGDSGHAFMMLASLGDYCVEILERKSDPFLINLFSWEREREQLNKINGGLGDPRALPNLKMASANDWIIREDLPNVKNLHL